LSAARRCGVMVELLVRVEHASACVR
jgi:hypothetical protein